MSTAKQIDLDAVLDYEWAYSAELAQAKVDGNHLTGLCPFHNDHNAGNFSVDTSTGKFHCFACGEQGNFISFIAKKYNMSSKDAYKKILVDNHLDTPAKSVSAVSTVEAYTVAEYALEKRLPVEWLQNELGLSAGKDRNGGYIRIPYWDENHNDNTFRKRYHKTAKQRFGWNRGATISLYGMWRIEQIREAGYVVLVEGESDAQTLWHLGFSALGVPGANTFKREWCDALSGLKVILHIEPDQGGEAFFAKCMRDLSDGGFSGELYTMTCGPLGVKDPSQLWCRDGDDAKDKIQNLIDTAQAVSLDQQVIPNMVEGAPVALRQPDGWLFGEDGIRMVLEDGNVSNICATPVMITKRLKSRDTGMERVEISFKRDGKWQSINMGRSSVFTSRGIVALADYGVTVNSENAKYLVRYLDALEKQNLDVIDRVESTEQTGWQKGGEFMPYFCDGVVFDTANAHIIEYLCKNGTMEKWVETMAPHRERWRFRFILAASFAAPLLAILKCRIFCVYNWADSRGGKTAAMKAALSVWGDPDNLMCTYNGTENAIEAYCATMNDLPVGIDERQISGANDKGLARFIYKLCEGTGRKRLNKDSSMRSTKTWRNVYMTTGEEPIISSRTMTGVSSRIIEIEGRPFETEADAALMHKATGEDFGWAGPAFLEDLRTDEQRAAVRALYEQLMTALGAEADGNNASHIACVACVGLADVLCGRKFFGEDNMTAIKKAVSMCQNVLKSIVENQPDNVNDNAIQYIADYILQHRQNFDTKDQAAKLESYGLIDNECVYIRPTAFDKICEDGGYSARKTSKDMAVRGYLKFQLGKDGKRTYSVTRRENGIVVRYRAILKSKLYGDSEGENQLELADLGDDAVPF